MENIKLTLKRSGVFLVIVINETVGHFDTYPHHNHKKRKDSLLTRAVLTLPAPCISEIVLK